MEFKALFVLLLFLCVTALPVNAAIINPSVESQPFFCKYTITEWTPLCVRAQGKGDTTINADNNTFLYNTSINESTTISNETSFFNLTIGNNLTTISNYTYFTLVNITYSEMNQTVGPAGPQGPQGIPGPEGPMNQTFNLTANMTMNMTVNMTANMTAGPKGDKGDKGDTGLTGATGSTGAAGPAGLDANVSTMWPVNSVFTSVVATNPNTLLGAGTWSLLTTSLPLTVISPRMVSNAIPYGYTTTASSEYSGTYPAWKASDSDASTLWTSSNGANTAVRWWVLKTPEPHVVTNYTIVTRVDDVNDMPKNWTLNGSTNGATWTTLDTQTMQTSWGAGSTRTYNFTNTNAYTYFNITITMANYAGTNNVGFGDIFFYEYADPMYTWKRTV